MMQGQAWPSLPLDEWRDTYATLHMWMQMVGKTQLFLAPPQNHWWHVALHLTARGLGTGPLPYGSRTVDIEFDFVEHRLVIRTSDPAQAIVPLEPQSVAAFYRRYMAALGSLGIDVKIWPVPVEVERVIPFAMDEQHASYDPEYANRYWRVVGEIDRVFRQFRGRFIGKSSPVHFFWGAFDLATTRFSGRRASERPSANAFDREAYSHEVISAGFSPGGGAVREAVFYAYAVPEPEGFRDAVPQPSEAYYQPQMSEFILPYETVRQSTSPAETLMTFLESTYQAGADLAGWDRAALDRH